MTHALPAHLRTSDERLAHIEAARAKYHRVRKDFDAGLASLDVALAAKEALRAAFFERLPGEHRHQLEVDLAHYRRLAVEAETDEERARCAHEADQTEREIWWTFGVF